jgi:tetratricopeptide (TPR) repeat protein
MPPESPNHSSSPLGPYLATPIKLFIHDRTLLQQTAAALKNLGFAQVDTVAVKANFFQSMRQLFGEISGFEGLVLVNHPPKKAQDDAGVSYQDMALAEFYQGVASFNKSSRRTTADILGCCVPIFVSAQDHDIRMRAISDLFPFGILGAFMVAVQPLGQRKEEALAEREDELYKYLLEYFESKGKRQKELKEYKSAEELAQRRAEADKLKAEVEALKEAKDYDKAIALCRRITEVLPTDPEAFLEGGRLLVKKRKYPPAMQMFRDAEQVAEDLPAPSQEIADLRIAQVKEHVAQRRQAGQMVDEAQINAWLAEATESYQNALNKADKIRALDAEKAQAKRADAQAQIAENILTQDLADYLGPNNPHVRELGRLAQTTLNEKLRGQGEPEPRHLVQFGLMAYYDGKLDEAERQLVKAAQSQEVFQDACTKLNYIGTQLRRRDKFDQAIRFYNTLLKLKPSFRGVALFNLAVALAAKALAQTKENHPQARKTNLESLVTCVEAIYVDPGLPQDPNFYENRVVQAAFSQAKGIFNMAAAGAPAPAPVADNPTDLACRQATGKLEALLKAGNQREALHMLYKLTGTLKAYFLEFQKHASPQVQDFAQRLHPMLLKHKEAKMRTFGKVIGILLARGKAAAQTAAQAGPPVSGPLNQAFSRAMSALNQAQQAKAARELALVFAAKPDLLKERAHTADETLINLCREIKKKLDNVELERFAR